MQRQGSLSVNHEQEDRTNGAYGSKSHGGHKSDIDDTIRDSRLLDTPYTRGDRHGYNSSSNSDKNSYEHHQCHSYRRSDKGYFPDEFKKVKPPNFDGEVNKSQHEKIWFLGMNNLFKLHDYSKNMKAKMAKFSPKGI